MRETVSIFMLAAIALVSLPSGSVFARAQLGEAAPALIVPELDGQTFDLGAERGKVVVINFWATWCQPCREEMPALNAFYLRYRDKGLVMIGVSADRPHDRSEVAKAMQSLSYPVAMMRDAKANGFGAPVTLPTTFIVGRDGIVRAMLTPDETKVTEASLGKAVLPLLPSKPAS
ncbi:MAG TPA: TlpA disulfide reductase family protein [Candidatus Binataceae bacterium]|nr:TlpA disulfide reductase family protein [Candidatus Binataceae bacterium]